MVKYDPLLKEKMDKEVMRSEQNDILTPSNLQYKKEMAESFENMTNPLKIQENKLRKRRSQLVQKNKAKVGL